MTVRLIQVSGIGVNCIVQTVHPVEEVRLCNIVILRNYSKDKLIEICVVVTCRCFPSELSAFIDYEMDKSLTLHLDNGFIARPRE